MERCIGNGYERVERYLTKGQRVRRKINGGGTVFGDLANHINKASHPTFAPGDRGLREDQSHKEITSRNRVSLRIG
jgi:hypothetical protein